MSTLTLPAVEHLRAEDLMHYRLQFSPCQPDLLIVIDRTSSTSWRIHREDADPEHRFLSYQIAAWWFHNNPAND